MKNISFDNPYLLLLIIPLALAVIIPYLLSVSKDNSTAGWKISLGLHLAVSMLVTLALAGLASITVLTKTTVYVLADVSYSSSRSLDEIDGYIEDIKENLPVNSTLGVVCFGKDSVVLTPAGRALKSVSEATVDGSATDIVSALNYTETLFKGDSLKRIVLITDGNHTESESTSGLASVVERLVDSGIKLDTIFINNTLKDGECEVQISDVDHVGSTYLGRESSATVLVQSSERTNALVKLYARVGNSTEKNLVAETAVTVDEGFTAVTLPLSTDVSATVKYEVALEADSDISPHNNTYTFTQTVADKTRVLLVTGKSADVSLITDAYGDTAQIDAYTVGASAYVPFMIEQLATYDEIVLSNVDVRKIHNVGAFINSLDVVVTQYGKSLVTLGNLYIQDEPEDPVFTRLQELLPVEYGTSAREGKAYVLILDISDSMELASKLFDACEAVTKLLSLMEDEDSVALITFYGAVETKYDGLVSEKRQEIVDYVTALTKTPSASTGHGSDIGQSLEDAFDAVELLERTDNQVVVISDGRSFDSKVDSVEMAESLYASGISVSTVTVYTNSDENEGRSLMNSIASAGGGSCVEIHAGTGQVGNVVFGEFANVITESVITDLSPVHIARVKDPVNAGIRNLPSVDGFIRSLAKYDATVPLTVKHTRPGGLDKTLPLYAYRTYGNGRVASLTTSLTGEWSALWSVEQKSSLLSNVLSTNSPEENVDYPFTVTVEHSRLETYLEVKPSVIYANAKTTVKITSPNGRTVTRDMTFDSQKYFHTLQSAEVGAYRLLIEYELSDGTTYTATVNFDVSYLSEYDAFAVFDKANVYEFMRNLGTITEGEIPSLENDESEISTYKVSYGIPLLIAAMVLFILDILLRTLKLRKDKKAKRKKGEIV